MAMATAKVQARTMSEGQEQACFFRWVAWQRQRTPEVDLFFHVPNGGSRDKREAAKMKGEGVRAGVPDLCLPVARGNEHGLFIELKVKGGRVSDAQKTWLKILSGQGYRAVVCYGWMEAVKATCAYLGIAVPEGLN